MVQSIVRQSEEKILPHSLCAVIAGGERDTLDSAATADFIVAVDRGYRYTQEQGIIPHLVVGDFDSYDDKQNLPDNALHLRGDRDQCGKNRPQIITLPKSKDDSDTLAALRYCLQLGYRNFRLYCALGGRLDHLIANLQAFSFVVETGAELEIISTHEYVTYLHNASRIFPRRRGFSLSVFSLSDISAGVGIKGARYELADAKLTRTFPLGLSNEWGESDSVEVSVADGTLIIVQSRLEID